RESRGLRHIRSRALRSWDGYPAPDRDGQRNCVLAKCTSDRFPPAATISQILTDERSAQHRSGKNHPAKTGWLARIFAGRSHDRRAAGNSRSEERRVGKEWRL